MPPFVGVAVKTVFAPVHIGLDPVVIAILIEGVTVAVTFMVIVFEVAVVAVTQPPATVIVQVMALPFAKEVLL